MNSVFNEHPSRKISKDFIDKAVAEARQTHKEDTDSREGVEAFKFMLESSLGNIHKFFFWTRKIVKS